MEDKDVSKKNETDLGDVKESAGDKDEEETLNREKNGSGQTDSCETRGVGKIQCGRSAE